MKKETFDELIMSAKEAVAIKQGKIQPARITTIRLPDVKSIRSKTHLRQEELANIVGVSISLVQAWEQHRRTPAGSSFKLLRIIDKHPDMVNLIKMA